MKEDEIIDQLRTSTNLKLRNLSAKITRTNLDNLIRNATLRMVNEEKTSPSDIDLAKSNFDKFLEESAKLDDKLSVEIGKFPSIEGNGISLKGICPLWPIC